MTEANTVSYPAGSTSLSRGDAVKISGSQVVKATADTDEPFGVVQEVPDNLTVGDNVAVAVAGRAEVRVDGSSGAGLSTGDELMPSNTNNGAAESHTGNAGEYYLGRVTKDPAALDGTSDGELVACEIYDRKPTA